MPASRSDATVAPGARFASFLPSSPRMSPWCRNSGGAAPSASNSLRWRFSFGRWSKPRTMCVIPKSASSTTLALPDRAFFPRQPQPLEIADDLLLTAWNVPLRIRVVDPEQHPVAQPSVRDGAERVPDVKRAGGAGSEADAGHGERLPRDLRLS